MKRNTPLKALRSITPPPKDSSLNTSFRIVSGLGEIDEDLEELQKDLRKAERGIFVSSELDEDDFHRSFRVSSSPRFTSKKPNVNRSLEDVVKSEESFQDQVTHLERENYSLNSDLLRLTKENKKLVTDILQKNLRIRELRNVREENVRNSHEFQKVNTDLHVMKTENLRLSRGLREREEELSALRIKLSGHSGSGADPNVSSKLQQYVNGYEEEKTKLKNSEEFLKGQISILKNEIGKLRKTQKQSLELTQAQQEQFEKQKDVDRERIRQMKLRYENKFGEVKKEFDEVHQKIKMDYDNDVNRYKSELEKRDREISKLRSSLRSSLDRSSLNVSQKSTESSFLSEDQGIDDREKKKSRYGEGVGEDEFEEDVKDSNLLMVSTETPSKEDSEIGNEDSDSM